MKYIKLFFISVVVFGVMLFCMSLLFPSTTIVSRAVNVKGEKAVLSDSMPQLYQLAFSDTAGANKAIRITDSIIRKSLPRHPEFPMGLSDEVVSSSIFKLPFRDTLLLTTPFAAHIQQGVALYNLSNDSTAVQVFYKIHVPTYKFWDKFGLMLNETKYGPSLDSATKRIAERF